MSLSLRFKGCMRVHYTFRLSYKHVAAIDPDLLSIDRGADPLKLTVVVEANEDDEIFKRVARAERANRARFGTTLIGSWTTKRSYDPRELEAAEAFCVECSYQLLTSGEDCGTLYDVSTGCPFCRLDRETRGPFYIDTRKIPKRYDLVRSNDFEYLVSQRFAEMVIEEGLTGMRLTPVVDKAKPITHTYLAESQSGRLILEAAKKHGLSDLNTFEAISFINRPEFDTLYAQSVNEWSEKTSKSIKLHRSRPWYRLEIAGATVAADTRTRYGSDLFDDRSIGGTCPLGHLGGANIISEVWLATGLARNVDIAQLKPGVGYVALDTLWAYRPLIISNRFRRALARWKIGGAYIEIARVAS